ncbi:hypothetical protein C8Q76DRAFT_801358 [Earliella scabrosa]|nr:hypothetical protein C8Q76DRAFT_801358 [Earliella scabrosa]
MMLNILYEQAMAGFAHSPSWKRVHAMLLIGPFFTHVAWSSRPPDNSLAPIKHVRVPEGKKSKDEKTETDTQDYANARQQPPLCTCASQAALHLNALPMIGDCQVFGKMDANSLHAYLYY